jgi:hypothetical protein
VSSADVGWTGTTPSIARFGSQYEVVWVQFTSSTSSSLLARKLNAAGKPLGPVITVLKNWAGFAGDPTILNSSLGRVIAFGGTQGSGGAAFNNGAEHFATSADGVTWTPSSTKSLSADVLAEDNAGAAVVNTGGQNLISGIAENQGVAYHIGIASSNPAPLISELLTAQTGNFSADAGLGVDAKTGQVWALWFSNSGINGKDGVNAQEISPALGARIHAAASSDPVTKSIGPTQDLSAASRTTGGVYTAFVNPKASAIDVWKIGAAKPLATFKDINLPTSPIVTPAPSGRLWVYWRDRNGWRATRSNKALTRWEKQSTISVPTTWNPGLHMAAVGSAGPLEAIATATTPKLVDEIRGTQFLPRLSISVSPTSVKRGHTFTVTVTDAGDPVQGAYVHFNGTKVKTDKHGQVTLKAPNSLSPGKHGVSATIGGYTGASTKIDVLK